MDFTTNILKLSQSNQDDLPYFLLLFFTYKHIELKYV